MVPNENENNSRNFCQFFDSSWVYLNRSTSFKIESSEAQLTHNFVHRIEGDFLWQSLKEKREVLKLKRRSLENGKSQAFNVILKTDPSFRSTQFVRQILKKALITSKKPTNGKRNKLMKLKVRQTKPERSSHPRL